MPKRDVSDDILRLTTDEPYAAYSAARETYLTSHALIEFARNPLLHRKKSLGLVADKDSDAFRVGRATHTYILEGEDRFTQDWIVGGPINPKTGAPYGEDTKAYAEWAEAQGKPVISDAAFSLLCGMKLGVQMNPVAARLLACGYAERTIRATIRDFLVQARLDWVACDGEGADLCDLKTCADLDDFADDIWRYGYPWQQAYYLMVAEARGLKLPLRSHLIAVEKQEPFRCGVFELGASTLRGCQRELTAAMWAMREAARTPDLWPTGAERVRTVRRPKALPAFGGEFITSAIEGAKEESWL